MNFPWFIARRIYNEPGSKKRVSRPAITIATAGVAIGLAVMIVSVAIVVGFKHSIREKIIGFGSHIQVTNFIDQVDAQESPIYVGDSIVNAIKQFPGIQHVERFTNKQGVLKTNDDFLGVNFEGVAQDYDSTFIHSNLKAGYFPRFSDSVASNNIVISQSIADKLNLKCKQKIFAYFIDKDGVRIRRFTIAGIYQTNLSQYDNVMCFTDLYTTVKLNGWNPGQVSGLAVTVKDFNRVDDIERYFVSNINRHTDKYGQTYTSRTIRDINPQTFSWLNLLDMNVWIILLLMMAVAGVTMISGLLIIILERVQMIGTLKSLGASNSTIRHIFLWFAIFIIGKGMLIGDILGLALVAVQKYLGLVKLDPSVYYVNTVPVELPPLPFLVINAITLVVSILILVAPSFLISHVHPARTMKYE